MRRLLMVLSSAMVIVFAATPASAQTARDPFEPLVEESSGSGTTSTGTTTTTSEEDRAPTQSVGGTSEQLPTTGAETDGWLVLAYGLIALGAGGVVAARTLSPQAAPKQR